MTEITRETDIRLEVMRYGCRRKVKEKKTDNEQLIWKRKKIKEWKKKKKDTCQTSEYWKGKLKKKKKKKKREKNQKIFLKKKMEKKKMKDDTNTFSFLLTLSFGTVACFYCLVFYIWLLQWCYWNFVNQFDMRKSSALVWENNLLSSITNDFILWGGKVCYIIAEWFFLYYHFSLVISYHSV